MSLFFFRVILENFPARFSLQAQKQTATKQEEKKLAERQQMKSLPNSIEFVVVRALAASAQSLNNKATTAGEAEIETD